MPCPESESTPTPLTEVIRRAVHAFYEKKEYPTLSCILMKVKEDSSFPGGRFCLWRILKEMGRDKHIMLIFQPIMLFSSAIF